MARTIANDLNTGRVFSSTTQASFEAVWNTNVDAVGMGLHLLNM